MLMVAMSSKSPIRIHAAIPVMDELEYLPSFLENVARQTYRSFHLWACVNQPDEWWHDPERRAVCERNQRCLKLLREERGFLVRVIDRSSPGTGWPPKRGGVGWARKTVMDAICDEADKDALIVSMDADTAYEAGYFRSLLDSFDEFPDAAGIAVPYFHHLTKDTSVNRAILRYEIYLRYYVLNLFRARSPYAFTALGSAIALPVKAYRAVGGLKPRQAGEDFYLLQKLCKYGRLLKWNMLKVYPSARPSDRVPFGTGIAVAKGREGDMSGYPIFDCDLFDDIADTYALFPVLFDRDVETPMSGFLSKLFRTNDIWGPLRRNYTDREHFIRACHERVDGLRILQYLKARQALMGGSDGERLVRYLRRFHFNSLGRKENAGEDKMIAETLLHDETAEFDLDHVGIQTLDAIRCFLSTKEDECRINR
ncbi:MAG: glycosyltransferase family 2 protein [Candidatus Tritonobacter lacicola]|nr:glycosyltransferase family 2 protein [Candidatus Tritonobacter lacicola]